MSWIDLSFNVLRNLCGAEAAKKAADFTVVDSVPSTQTIYIPPGYLVASNSFVLEAEQAVRQAGEGNLTSAQLAHAVGAPGSACSIRLGTAGTGITQPSRWASASTVEETSRVSIPSFQAITACCAVMPPGLSTACSGR